MAECVCGEINTRHCPVHGQGGALSHTPAEMRAEAEAFRFNSDATGRLAGFVIDLSDALVDAERRADENWASYEEMRHQWFLKNEEARSAHTAESRGPTWVDGIGPPLEQLAEDYSDAEVRAVVGEAICDDVLALITAVKESDENARREWAAHDAACAAAERRAAAAEAALSELHEAADAVRVYPEGSFGFEDLAVALERAEKVLADLRRSVPESATQAGGVVVDQPETEEARSNETRSSRAGGES